MNQVPSPIVCASSLVVFDQKHLAELPASQDIMNLPKSTSSDIPASVFTPLVSILAYFAFLYLLHQIRTWMKAINLAFQLLYIQPRSSGKQDRLDYRNEYWHDYSI